MILSDIVRPIISGILGATVAAWLTKKWKRWVPGGSDSKSKKSIVRENAVRIRVANWLCLIGFLAGFVFYLSGYLSRYDWRGLGVAVGLAATLPVLWMIGSSVSGGRQGVRECLLAFSISQRTPIPILFGLLFLGALGGIVSSVSLIVNPPSTIEATDGERLDSDLDSKPGVR